MIKRVTTLFSRTLGYKSTTGEDLEKIHEMKVLVESDDHQPTEEFMKNLVKLVHKYRRHAEISYTTSHIVSILALQEASATFLIEKGICKQLRKMLQYHSDNPHTLSKICAAIWNLLGVCQPSQVPKSLFSFLWQTLIFNTNSPRVVYTAIGALSNLALVAPNPRIMRTEKIQTLKSIVKKYKHSPDICNHFGAFVANMCVNWFVAAKCIDVGYVTLLVDIVRTSDSKGDVCSHILAAIHNMSDAGDFLKQFCQSRGIEVLQNIARKNIDNPEIMGYIHGIYTQAMIPESAVTSLHIAAASCTILDVVHLLMTEHYDSAALNKRNHDGFTACGIALQRGDAKIVEMLVACGAKFSMRRFKDLTWKHRKRMRRSVKRGRYHHKTSRKALKTVLKKNANLVEDMGGLIAKFIPGVEMLALLQPISV